jgi:hypothetical protein
MPVAWTCPGVAINHLPSDYRYGYGYGYGFLTHPRPATPAT